MKTLSTLAQEVRRQFGKSPRIVRESTGVWKAEVVGVAAYDTTREGALERLLDASAYDDEPRCCSLCDAPGHGYPGGGPCPLENMGEPMDAREEEAIARYEAEMRRACQPMERS